jgi:predicted phosphodiesterase
MNPPNPSHPTIVQLRDTPHWSPSEIEPTFPAKQLSQSFLAQVIWNIEFPLLMAGVGSVCIGSALGFTSLALGLAADMYVGFQLDMPWWWWLIGGAFGIYIVRMSVEIIVNIPSYIGALIFIPLFFAGGLRTFVVERILHALGGNFIRFWVEGPLRSLFLLLFLVASLICLHLGVSLFPDVIAIATHRPDGFIGFITVLVVCFPSVLSLGFAYCFAANAAYQLIDFWRAAARSLSYYPILVDDMVSSENALLTIAHLSDLHLTEDVDSPVLEGGTAIPNLIFSAVIADLGKRIQTIDLVVVTGDITDSGMAKEWDNFFKIVPPELLPKFIIVPGNHDINITSKYSIWRTETNAFVGRNVRLIRSMCAIDTVQGNKCVILDEDDNLISLRAYITQHRDTMLEYLQSGKSVLDFLGSAERKTPEPDKIWERVFPMAIDLPEAGVVLYILDSNDISVNLFDNAFGFVQPSQVKRLDQLLERHKSRNYLLAMHHHIALPRRLKDRQLKGRIFEKFMVLRNSRTLMNALTQKREAVILHGHRHVDYRGSLGNVQVISAPSTTLGSIVPIRAPGYYIHTLGIGPNRGLAVNQSQFIEIGRGAATATGID